MIDRFGYLDGFFAAGDALGERLSSARQSTNQTREPIAGRLATPKNSWSSSWRNTTFFVRKSIACR